MKKLRLWLLAVRPKTLLLAFSGVMYGLAVSLIHGSVSAVMTLCAFFAAMFLQITSNLVNDFADFQNGVDSDHRTGPVRSAGEGRLYVRELQIGAVVSAGAAALSGLYPVITAGWPVLLLGLSAIAAAVFYTWGPRPYGYYALGEVFVFLYFGIASVCGTYFLNTGHLNFQILLFSAVPGLYAVLVLQINNIRDIVSDKAAGRHTVANLVGRRIAVILFFATLAALAGLQTASALYADLPLYFLASLVTLIVPFTAAIVFAVRRSASSYNAALGATAAATFVNAVIFISCAAAYAG